METPPNPEAPRPIRRRHGFEEHQGTLHGQPVYVAVTSAGHFANEQASFAFSEVVRGAMQVHHPHVARTVQIEAFGTGRWKIHWERFSGTSLSRVLADRGHLFPDEAVSITLALAQALSAAHEVGVLHGAVGPEWVTLTPTENGLDTKLGGFGLGQLAAFAGGPKPTIAADLLGLGVLFHQLLTGLQPQGEVARLPQNAVHLTPILNKALGYDKAERFRSAADFERALTEANRTRISSGKVVPSVTATRPGGTSLTALGPWDLVELIGEGAMGQVFLARHRVLGRQAAIKVLRAEQYRRPDLVQRFFQEARAVSQINHEHIVEISDFGQELDAAGKPVALYYVMELLHGETLTLRLGRGKLSVEHVVHIVRQVASALAAAHRLGVVHRDLKADNVFLTSRRGDKEYVKVLDFGVAKMMDDAAAVPMVSTIEGAIIGTPTNMSPEQASGAEVDQRTDVYAAGVLLYQMLSGKLPFEAESFAKLVMLVCGKPADPLPEKTPAGEDIPPALAAVVMRCLEKEAAKRPQSMDELLDALAVVPEPVRVGRRTQEIPLPPKRRGRTIAAVLSLVVLAAAVGFWVWPSPAREQSPFDAGVVLARATPAPEPAVVVPTPEPVAEVPDASLTEAEVDAGQEVESPQVAPPKAKPVKLTAEMLQATVLRDRQGVLKCLERFRLSLPSATGSVRVQFTVEMSGATSRIEILEAAFKQTPLENCLVKAVQSFRFPRNVGPPQRVTIPFNYREGAGSP